MVQQQQGNRIYVEPNADIPQDFGTLVYTKMRSPYWGVLFHTLDELQIPEYATDEDGNEQPVFVLSPLWVLKTAGETEDGSEYYYRTNLYVGYVDNDYFLIGIDPEGGLLLFHSVDVEDLTRPQEDTEEEWEPLWEEGDEEDWDDNDDWEE